MSELSSASDTWRTTVSGSSMRSDSAGRRLASTSGGTCFPDRRRAGGRVLVQLGGEELVAVAAEVLRPVHREVGEPQQRRHVLAILRHAGDADARAGDHLVLADAIGLAELLEELLRHRRRL